MAIGLARPRSPGLAAAGAAAPTLRRRAQRLFGEDWLTAWVFTAPMLLLMASLIGWPILQAFWMSFWQVIGPRWVRFVGFDNYLSQLGDPIVHRTFAITVQFTAEAIAIKFVLGLIAALALHNLTRFRSVLTGLILAPYIVPEVVTAAMWRFLYNPQFGGLNATLKLLYTLTHPGASDLKSNPWAVAWTGDPAIALHAMVAVNVWKGVPFFTLLALAGLKAIDRELYDAAAVDGANAWQRLLHVTLPGLRYVIIVETLFSTISTFNTFGLIYLITAGGPGGATRVYALRVYELIGSLLFGRAVALAMLMVPILGCAVIVLGHYMRAGQRGFEGREGPLYLLLLFLLWPVKMALRLAVRLFWIIDYALEGVAAWIARLFFAVVTGGSARRKRRITRIAGAALVAVPVAVIAFIELYPFYWIVVTAFKTNVQIQQVRSVFWPNPWTLVHFQWLFQKSDFPLWLRNTVIVAIVSTVISLCVSSLGAYALVRLRWRGAGAVSTSILLTYLMPGIMLVVPLYLILSTLHLVNTLGSLMLAYPTFLLPFACWLLMGYYRSIPEELEEAALIDGCNRFQAFFRIVLPLVTPALVAVALFAVTGAWNEFLLAFVLIQSNAATTLPVGLGRLIFGDVFPWGDIMAASVAMAIPVIAFYSIAQRYLVEGLTAGSVKG